MSQHFGSWAFEKLRLTCRHYYERLKISDALSDLETLTLTKHWCNIWIFLDCFAGRNTASEIIWLFSNYRGSWPHGASLQAQPEQFNVWHENIRGFSDCFVQEIPPEQRETSVWWNTLSHGTDLTGMNFTSGRYATSHKLPQTSQQWVTFWWSSWETS